MSHSFGEHTKEWSVKSKKEIPVWMTPKYETSKAKAIEMIDSGKYGLSDADFWILMNETKSEKMAYTGLIISHNGCLKINDALDSKFKPSCVSLDKVGYGSSLVYTYCCDEQGIYEVGEVSKDNCKNAYPYAMAYKRLFDRVVLKLSKLAYSGVYSEAEADEFREPAERSETKVDNSSTDAQNASQGATQPSEEDDMNKPIGANTAVVLAKMCEKKNVNIEKLCAQYKVASLKDLSGYAYADIVRKFQAADKAS